MPPASAVAASADRSRRRYRRATLTFAVSLAAKGVALFALLASVPASLAYLGSERFGLWMTALSAAGVLGIANFGLDKALLNALAAADSRGNRAAARRLVAAAMLTLAAVLAVLAITFSAAAPALPGGRWCSAGGRVPRSHRRGRSSPPSPRSGSSPR